MPELPEVENLRRGLERRVVGQTIKSVSVKTQKLVFGKGGRRSNSPAKTAEFIRGLSREKIVAVERRAKNLIFRTKGGKVMLVHLKMTGQFVYREHGKNLIEGGHPVELSSKEIPNRHTHVVFELSKGTLYYNDPRMFGYLLYYRSEAAFLEQNHFGSLGLEPLDPAFTLAYFREALKKRKGKLKTVLMDQKIVTGLGNIYADEVAFEAKVRPTRSTPSLKDAEIEKIYKAIMRIIPAAIKLGGSSVASYRLLDMTRGNYAREHKVYGKTGERCEVCGTPLKTVESGGRTTVFCPNCQR